MAVVATLSKGYDLDYIWKQVDRGPAKDAASYYIQASDSGGEPPGRWWGPGAKALGFEPGQTVERRPYDLLFGERKAPDGTQLGRPPGNGRKAADLYVALLAAEPHATAERKRELRTEAVKKARQSPLFFDLTLSLSKSISIFHASLGENARLARQAGDRDASNFKTRAAKDGALDLAQLHAGWADKLARSLGVSLASIAPSVWHEGGRAATRGATSPGPAPTETELAHAAQKALALAQQDKSAWTRADVIKHLGRVLPRTGINPAAAAAMLENLADRALASEFEPVVCLEAPELADVPPSMRRADGRSIYQRHGGTRYATRAHWPWSSACSRKPARAPRHGWRASRPRTRSAPTWRNSRTRSPAPRRARASSSRRPGCGRTRPPPHSRRYRRQARVGDQRPGRIRQDPRPGRSRPHLGRGRLGPVIGITPSQSARNTLAAGVPRSYNAAQFLGHLPGRRGARGPVPIRPGTLLVVDEASMLSGPDLADLIAYARARGAKVILAGDLSQLQAVENGGGMSLLAARLGYARLAEPVRFRHPWEQHASLRLRDGDTTVLADYDQHGRIHGGDPEQTMDAAAAAYVALTTSGTDTLLMAADHALRRELNRRIRDDLIALGLVQDQTCGNDRRGRPGQPRRPDHLHPQRPRHRGRGTRSHAGQRRPAPHRGRHPRRPARPPRPGRRPAHRAAPLDRPTLPVQLLSKMPSSATRSPTTRPRAVPCTPAWP